MSDFEFENCMSAVLKCGSNVLGGVEKAACTRKNSYTEIKEFLNDKPIERIISTEWQISLRLRLSDETPFAENDYFERLELALSEKTIVYKKCRITKFKAESSDAHFTAEVDFSADEREIV